MAEHGLSGRRVLATGGNGFIGRRVVHLLAERGAEVVVPRLDPDGEELAATLISADLSDPAATREVMEGVDAVVHLAARSGGVQFQESSEIEVFSVNNLITTNVLAAAAAAGVGRVFLSSSSVVYREAGATPFTEASPVLGPGDRPTGYAWSKLTDEVLGWWWQSTGAFEAIVGRFANVYGPGGSFDPSRSTVVHSLIAKAMAAGPGGTVSVWGDGSAVRSFIYVDDAAAGVVAALEHGEAGAVYNVDSSEAVTIADLARQIARLVDPGLRLEFDVTRPVGAGFRVTDSTRLRRLGFEPAVSLAQGLERTVAGRR